MVPINTQKNFLMIKIDKNILSGDPSPYLKQHKNNLFIGRPVQGNSEYAKKTRGQFFLSIGYASCHWRHVMAHESFEERKRQN